ncbi:MAG: signal recognition particle receptor subunit alpha [Thaumarchaeota archaeon]|nr:signal recognition particle receptor subunit alpha [Candidatus Geocrenenecus arthurdayi]MCL7389196.1 signal recognition particle receptor subunit alpha [Candidatus Geocrenenecus arthurdayi]MCL7390501.1 signal recognition particle receptor subunit alpha [Candidatus Geocrenenecus arthurdayi]MCL7395978.1 signal recognition particle receptor subunit alpha [Candidatus Geocrenenecus arthurdayi]MCL7401602.1 signal recognition particle receptor subunit alpha [Candidatus Geocrenenecus arthurdayi]
MGMTSLGELLKKAISKFISSTSVDENTINELVRGIQRSLLIGDVSVELVQKISENVRKRALEEKLPPGISRKDQVIKIVYEELVKLLGEEPAKLKIPRDRRYIIMMVGIQGFGKTTSIAKLAYYLRKNDYSVGVICADTYRPGGCDQLEQLLRDTKIPVYRHDGEKDPVKIVKAGIEKLTSDGVRVILIDTAGRHKSQETLMEEVRNLQREVKPDEVMLVIDAGMGQQAGVHARAFHEAAPVGSIFLTKMDTSAKGGGALSAIAATGAKIKFIGTGEKIDEIELFNPAGYVSRLLGLGDIEGLLEKFRLAELMMDEKRAEAFIRGEFTLEQFVKQLKDLRRAGPLSKLISKLPLPGIQNIPDETLRDAEKQIEKWDAIIHSMTPEERVNPHVINSSRIKRIARGAGVLEKDVKNLIKQYRLAKKFMKTAKRLPKKFLKTVQ